MPVSPDDAGLVDRIAGARDPDDAARALAGLMNRYKRLVYAIAFDLARDRSLADDVFQETFVRLTVWMRGHATTEIRSFPRLLAAFVRRTTLELGRAGRREAPLEELEVSSPIVEQIYARELLAAAPEPARRILELTLVEGLSSQEAAAVLGLTAENVRVIKHRALRAIREEQARDLAHLEGVGDAM